MKMLPRVLAAATAVGDHVDRIKVYRGLAMHRNAETLLPAARRCLGLSE